MCPALSVMNGETMRRRGDPRVRVYRFTDQEVDRHDFLVRPVPPAVKLGLALPAVLIDQRLRIRQSPVEIAACADVAPVFLNVLELVAAVQCLRRIVGTDDGACLFLSLIIGVLRPFGKRCRAPRLTSAESGDGRARAVGTIARLAREVREPTTSLLQLNGRVGRVQFCGVLGEKAALLLAHFALERALHLIDFIPRVQLPADLDVTRVQLRKLLPGPCRFRQTGKERVKIVPALTVPAAQPFACAVACTLHKVRILLLAGIHRTTSFSTGIKKPPCRNTMV